MKARLGQSRKGKISQNSWSFNKMKYYLFTITIADPEVVVFEQEWTNGGNLRVEFRGSRQGRRSTQQYHAAGILQYTRQMAVIYV